MTPSSSFDILSLPLLPLTIIFKKMEIKELLNLSYISKNIQNFLKQIPIRSGGFRIILDQRGICIQMINQNFVFEKDNENKSIILDYLNEYDYLEKVFPGGINHLAICPIAYSDYIHRIPKECNVLTVGNAFFSSNNESEFNERSESLIDSLLNHIDFKMGLALNLPIKVSNKKMFNIDWLTIRNSGWVTSSILDQLQNKIICLQNSSLSGKEINEFLHKLKNGNGNNRLKVMTIKDIEGLNMNEIIDGLDTFLVKKQIFEMELNGSIFSDEFLPSLTNGLSLNNTLNFKRKNGSQITIRKIFSSIQILVSKSEFRAGKRKIDESLENLPVKRIRLE